MDVDKAAVEEVPTTLWSRYTARKANIYGILLTTRLQVGITRFYGMGELMGTRKEESLWRFPSSLPLSCPGDSLLVGRGSSHSPPLKSMFEALWEKPLALLLESYFVTFLARVEARRVEKEKWDPLRTP